MSTKIDEPVARAVVRTLSTEVEGAVSPQTIEAYVNDSLASFRDARIKEFVPLLVYRMARERVLGGASP
jgi:hypothetical protein